MTWTQDAGDDFFLNCLEPQQPAEDEDPEDDDGLEQSIDDDPLPDSAQTTTTDFAISAVCVCLLAASLFWVITPITVIQPDTKERRKLETKCRRASKVDASKVEIDADIKRIIIFRSLYINNS